MRGGCVLRIPCAMHASPHMRVLLAALRCAAAGAGSCTAAVMHEWAGRCTVSWS